MKYEFIFDLSVVGTSGLAVVDHDRSMIASKPDSYAIARELEGSIERVVQEIATIGFRNPLQVGETRRYKAHFILDDSNE